MSSTGPEFHDPGIDTIIGSLHPPLRRATRQIGSTLARDISQDHQEHDEEQRKYDQVNQRGLIIRALLGPLFPFLGVKRKDLNDAISRRRARQARFVKTHRNLLRHPS